MATNVGEAVIHIVKALSGELGPDALAQAPQYFAQMAAAPGVAQVLVAILQDSAQHSLSDRMRVSVLLKRLIEDNWVHEGEAVTETEDAALANAHVSEETYFVAAKIAELRGLQQQVADSDKEFLRANLPGLLSDPTIQIRSNIAMSIAVVGEHDFPEKWPGLLGGLIQAAQNPDPNVVQGGLLCFNALLDRVIDNQLQTIAPEVFKTLVVILNNPATIPEVRIQALDLYSGFIQSFSNVEDPHERGFEKKFAALLGPTLSPMITICLLFIDSPVDAVNQPQSCQFNTRGAAVKALTRLITFFPVTTKAATDVKDALLDRLCAALATATNLYVETLVVCPETTLVPDQVTAGLTFFINCLIAFFDIMTETTAHFPKFVLAKLDKIIPSLCRAMLFSQADIETYRVDLSKFTADESSIDCNVDVEHHLNDAEATASVRSESLRFLRIALDKWFKTSTTLVVQAAVQMWTQGTALKSQGGNHGAFWWKHHEAMLLAIGLLLSSEKAFTVDIAKTTFPMPTIVETVVGLAHMPALAPGSGVDPESAESDPTFLQSRAFWLLSHCIRKLTTDLSSQLHKTKQYAEATQTQQLLYKCLDLLPAGLTQAPIRTQIACAHAIAACQFSFLAIDHSVLYYHCQQLNDQFYAQHPDLKADYDRCMASDEPIPLQPQFVNTIPIQIQSAFASHFPVYLERFCVLLDHVEEDGTQAVMQCILWMFNFFENWRQHLTQLVEMFPYLQFSSPALGPNQPGTILPQFEPHAATLTPQLMTTVVSKILQVWVQNNNNEILAETVVDVFHSISALKNNHIDAWAGSAYAYLLAFIKAAPSSPGASPVPAAPASDDQLSDAGAKMAAIGLISIMLRTLSPGPYFESTTSNLDPAKQTQIPLISTVEFLQTTIQTTPNSFQPLVISTVIPAEEIVTSFLPSIVALALQSREKTLTLGALAISASILAMYSPHLLQLYASATTTVPHPMLFQMLEQLAMSMVRLNQDEPGTPTSPTSPGSPALRAEQSIQDLLEVSDRDTPIAFRLIVQLLVTYKSVIGDAAWKGLLNVVITKLCTTEEHSLKFSALWIIARVGIHHTTALLQYLATECGTVPVRTCIKRAETIKSKKTGLYVKRKAEYAVEHQPVFFRLFNVFLQSVPVLTSGYIRRIAVLFLVRCMTEPTCVELLASLTNVQDEVISSTAVQPSGALNGSPFAERKDAGPMTRSKGQVVEQWSHCNAVTKILKLLCERGYSALVLSIDRTDESDADGLGLLQDNDTDSDNDGEAGDEGDGDDNMPAADAATVAALFGGKLGGADGDNALGSGSFDLSDLFDDDDDDSDDYGSDRIDYPESSYDRFYGVDTAALISSFVQGQEAAMANNQGPFALATAQLTQTQMTQVMALRDPTGFAKYHRAQKKQQQ